MRALLAYGAGTFFPRLYAFLAIFLFSRVLSVHDFGLYVLAIAVGEFCDYTTSSWFRVGFLRLYHAGTIQSDADRLNLTEVYVVTLRCIGVAIVMCWLSALWLVPQAWLIFGIVTSLYVIANGTVQATLNTLRGEDKALPYATIESLRPLISLAIGLAATRLFFSTFAVAAFGVFGANAFIGAVALGITWLRRMARGGRNRAREIIGYAWPLLLSSFLVAVMTAADRYQLQWWLGPHAVALYSASYAVGRQPLDILFFALNLGSFTELMKAYDMKGPAAASQLLGRQITLILAIVLPAAVGISLLAPDIMHALFDQRYWNETERLVPVIALMALFAGLRAHGYDQGFYMVHNMRGQVISMLPSVFVGVVVSALLIYVFGLEGAAYGSAIGFFLSLVLAIILVRRSLPVRPLWNEIGKIVFCVMLMATVVELLHFYGAGDKFALASTILIGILTYGVAAFSLNVLGSRHRFREGLIKKWS